NSARPAAPTAKYKNSAAGPASPKLNATPTSAPNTCSVRSTPTTARSDSQGQFVRNPYKFSCQLILDNSTGATHAHSQHNRTRSHRPPPLMPFGMAHALLCWAEDMHINARPPEFTIGQPDAPYLECWYIVRSDRNWEQLTLRKRTQMLEANPREERF